MIYAMPARAMNVSTRLENLNLAIPDKELTTVATSITDV